MTRGADEQFRVWLYDRPVAILYRHDDFTRLVFDAAYLADPRRAVLGLRFEETLRDRHSANKRLIPWFSNLLPEGRLREWIALARHVSVEREMELLIQVGHDLPGAVRVLPADEPLPTPPSDRDVSAHQTIATPTNLWRFSLAGVGLKFSMLLQGDRFTAPAVGEGGDWIVKLPDPLHAEVPRNELAMMSLGRAAGLDVPEVKLVHRDSIESLPDEAWSGGEEYAYAVRRFDRGARRELIHIEDFAQVRGAYPDDKYGGAFETVGALAYRRHDIASLREFARRLAFNFLIGNGDAHLKNWSLIYRDRRVPTLAPAYDLVATSIYRPKKAGAEDLGLKFGGTRRFDAIRLSAFDALDVTLDAKAGLGDLVAAFVARVLAAWPSVEDLFDENVAMRKAIGEMLTRRAAQLRR